MSIEHLSRRELLHATLAAGAVASVASLSTATLAAAKENTMKGNIKHSVVFWCFNVAGEKWDIDKTCQIAKSLGCES
ncbi:MAG: hydroxypyruvate isomerase, partial [Fuerstia sp.]|nr:hydroxypyruvate isomerase [Fuerstiella sp.]